MGSLEQLYQQVILDHAREKHGAGDPSGMDASSHQVNPTCGDEVTLGVTLDGQRLASLQWDGDGCSISRASLSMMTDLTEGKSAEEIGRLYRDMEVMMHSRNLGVDDEILDDLERECLKSHGVHLVIHYDPIVTDDPELDRMHVRVEQLLHTYDIRLGVHDFRMVPGKGHVNLIFDVVLPTDLRGQEADITAALEKALNQNSGVTYYPVITFDQSGFN